MQDNEQIKSSPLSYEPLPAEFGDGGWLRLQFNEHGVHSTWIPPLCCQCLCSTNDWWKLPLFYPLNIKVPLCDSCRKKCRNRYLRTVLCALALAVCASVLLWFLPLQDFDSGLRVAASALILFTGLLSSLFIGQFLALPIEIGFWWRGQRWVYIRFRNTAFPRTFEAFRREARPHLGRIPPRPPKGV